MGDRGLCATHYINLALFRYVPTDWATKTELSLDEVSELNTMNIELAGLLSKKNPAFTPFQHGNFSCIMIKEVSGYTQFSELLTIGTMLNSYRQMLMYKSLF